MGKNDSVERNRFAFPVQLTPSREPFENLGFQFGLVTLPPNWSIQQEKCYHGTYLFFLDDKDRKRGYSFQSSIDQRGYLHLYTRYHVKSRYLLGGVNAPVVVEVMDFDHTVLYQAGLAERSYGPSYVKVKEEAENWLSANFPNWENPLAYWD